MKFIKDVSEIDFTTPSDNSKEITYILPKGVIVRVIAYSNMDRFAIIVVNANYDAADNPYNKSFGGSYEPKEWYNKIVTTDGKTLLESWIRQSANDSTYFATKED